MYNRYIPNPQGGFERIVVQEPQAPVQPQPAATPGASASGVLQRLKGLLPGQMDTGEMLLLLIFLLVVLDAEQEDLPSAIFMLAAFIFG